MEHLTTALLLTPSSHSVLPQVIYDSGERARQRYLEFFLVTIRNPNTRLAYGVAASQFLGWCQSFGLTLDTITPVAVAAYIENHPGSVATVKLHLAALRNLFDWLVTGQVMKANPAASVRGPRYQIVHGKTPPLTAEEVRAFLASCDTETLAGQRDRALFAVMLYSFARVGAMLGTKVEDYYHRGKRGWLRLHEKGGRFHEVPLHHQAEEYLDAYLDMAGLSGAKGAFLFQAVDSSKMGVTGAPIGRRGVLARVKRVVKLLELHDGVCNHSFRATGITLFRKAGGSLDKARILAGHASTKTTQVYDHSGDEISANEVERIVI